MDIYDACIHNGDVWAIARKDAYLYRLTGIKEVLQESILLSRNGNIRESFSGIYIWEDSLLAVPMTQNYVVCYNLITKSLKYFDLPFQEGTEYNFATCHVFGNELVLFGWKFPGILRLNLLNGECEVIDAYVEECRERVANEPNGYCPGKCVMKGECFYLPLSNMNAILELNYTNNEVKIIDIEGENFRGDSIVLHEDDFWLVPHDMRNGILKWNTNFNSIVHFDDYPQGFAKDKRMLPLATTLYDNKIYIFAYDANMNIAIDITTGEIEKLPELDNILTNNSRWYKVIKLYGDTFFCMCNETLFYWNVKTNKIESFCFSVEKKIAERYRILKFQEILRLRKDVREGTFKLREYINAVVWTDRV